jgi:uncharacterized membrane protein (DUF2068 family)
VPRFHYELLICGIRGHELAGTDAAEVRPEDAVIAREIDGVRWYRCLRCDSWIPLPPPEEAAAPHPPALDEIELPLRGKALRDKVVLRVIAVDRAIHFLVLAAFAAAVFLFAAHAVHLRMEFWRVVNAVQGTAGTPSRTSGGGFLHELERLFRLRARTLYAVGVVASAYALLEGVEAIGLWLGRRWAEYLTFVATIALLPLELYELAHKLSPFRIVALVINLAIAVYLLLAKRLFGLRGGAAAETAERQRDSGFAAFMELAPEAFGPRRRARVRLPDHAPVD